MASIQSQLKGIDVKKLKTKSGKTLGKLLYEEAQRLRDCIQKRIDIYLNTFEPVMYERTGGLESSLRVDDFLNIRVVGNRLEIELFFDDGAVHSSGEQLVDMYGNEWDGNGEEVNTAFLVNYGYKVKKDVWFKDKENFGYREGEHFVEKGIEDFNATNKLGIVVDVIKYGYKV